MIPKSKSEGPTFKYERISKKRSKMTLNVDNAYRITEKLAFPRLVGSPGEQKAIQILVEEFKYAGYHSINRDNFKTSLYNWIYVRFIFLVLGSGLILLALSFYLTPFLTLALTVFNLYASSKALKISTSLEIKLCKNENYNFSTENVFVNLKSQNSKGKIVFIAHWDSKSQTFPTTIRMLIFLIFILGSLILHLLYVILSILRLFFNLTIPLLINLMLDASIIIAVIGSFNYFNKTGNKSFGAFDNAAAVGVLIELARYYRENPPVNTDLVFLSTGSEELNLGGIVHYINKYGEEFKEDTSFFINLDFVGGKDTIRLTTSYGIPRRSSSEKLNNLFFKNAEELKVKIKDIYSPSGVWSDYMPIVQAGFEACWLGSESGLKLVHTQNDNMKLVSKEGINNILQLCWRAVNKLDDEFNH
ncbi:MAG: M28 family metallopeptidase [Candidatus Thorarchaeota archaeon]